MALMHLDYTTHQGRRIPCFRTKQDVEQALLNGAIGDGELVAISRDSFPNAEPGAAYIWGEGLMPLTAAGRAERLAIGEVEARQAQILRERAAVERAAAELRAREGAARIAAEKAAARTAAERLQAEERAAALRQEAATKAAKEQAAAKRPHASSGAVVVKGATIAAVIAAGGIAGTSLIASFKKSPKASYQALPNGDVLVTYPDGSTATIDGKTGKVKSTSGPSGTKGASEGISDVLKWGAILAAAGFGGAALLRSQKNKKPANAPAAAPRPRMPPNAKPMGAA